MVSVRRSEREKKCLPGRWPRWRERRQSQQTVVYDGSRQGRVPAGQSFNITVLITSSHHNFRWWCGHHGLVSGRCILWTRYLSYSETWKGLWCGQKAREGCYNLCGQQGKPGAATKHRTLQQTTVILTSDFYLQNNSWPFAVFFVFHYLGHVCHSKHTEIIQTELTVSCGPCYFNPIFKSSSILAERTSAFCFYYGWNIKVAGNSSQDNKSLGWIIDVSCITCQKHVPPKPATWRNPRDNLYSYPRYLDLLERWRSIILSNSEPTTSDWHSLMI